MTGVQTCALPISLEDIFKDYDGEYKAEEFDWGSSVGKEVW